MHITKADKGGKIVILNKQDYKDKMIDLLSDTDIYKQLKKNPLQLWQRNFNFELNGIAVRYTDFSGFIKSFTSRLPSLPYAYGLPKVHKEGNTG